MKFNPLAVVLIFSLTILIFIVLRKLFLKNGKCSESTKPICDGILKCHDEKWHCFNKKPNIPGNITIGCVDENKPSCLDAVCRHGNWLCPTGDKCDPSSKPEDCANVVCIDVIQSKNSDGSYNWSKDWVCLNNLRPSLCSTHDKPTCIKNNSPYCVGGKWYCGSVCKEPTQEEIDNCPGTLDCAGGKWNCVCNPPTQEEIDTCQQGTLVCINGSWKCGVSHIDCPLDEKPSSVVCPYGSACDENGDWICTSSVCDLNSEPTCEYGTTALCSNGIWVCNDSCDPDKVIKDCIGIQRCINGNWICSSAIKDYSLVMILNKNMSGEVMSSCVTTNSTQSCFGTTAISCGKDNRCNLPLLINTKHIIYNETNSFVGFKFLDNNSIYPNSTINYSKFEWDYIANPNPQIFLDLYMTVTTKASSGIGYYAYVILTMFDTEASTPIMWCYIYADLHDNLYNLTYNGGYVSRSFGNSIPLRKSDILDKSLLGKWNMILPDNTYLTKPSVGFSVSVQYTDYYGGSSSFLGPITLSIPQSLNSTNMFIITNPYY